MPKFSAKKIPPLVEALINAAHMAPSADNSQPWRFVWDGHRLLLDYDAKRVAGRTFAPGAHATLLAMAAATENILQMAGHLGIKLKWGFSSEVESGYAWFDLAAEYFDCHPENTPAFFQRHTNRHSFSSSPLPKDMLERLKSSCMDSTKVCVLSKTAEINRVAAIVRRASALRFQNPAIHSLLSSSLRFSATEVQEGLDVRTLGLPPGGGLILRLVKEWKAMSALNRLGFYQMFALIEAHKLKQAGAIVAIVGPGSRQGTLSAGRLMEQVWIELNNRGIAVHPFYVVSDQLQRYHAGEGFPSEHKEALIKLDNEVASFLQQGDNVLHMLLRIGYPKKKPLLSKRLSCEKLLDDQSIT